MHQNTLEMHKDDIGKDNQLEVMERISGGRPTPARRSARGPDRRARRGSEKRQGAGAGCAITPVSAQCVPLSLGLITAPRSGPEEWLSKTPGRARQK